MSKQEQALSILKRFSDEELDRFIAYFSIIYPVANDEEKLTEKQKALREIQSIIHPSSTDIDDKKELEEYREEKYGK